MILNLEHVTSHLHAFYIYTESGETRGGRRVVISEYILCGIVKALLHPGTPIPGITSVYDPRETSQGDFPRKVPQAVTSMAHYHTIDKQTVVDAMPRGVAVRMGWGHVRQTRNFCNSICNNRSANLRTSTIRDDISLRGKSLRRVFTRRNGVLKFTFDSSLSTVVGVDIICTALYMQIHMYMHTGDHSIKA